MYSATDIDIIAKARAFAAERHAGQSYGARDYMWHVDMVVTTLARFGHYEASKQILGFVHDLVEEGRATLVEIASLFGESMRMKADLITDKPGANRREKHSNTYPAMRDAADIDVVIVKLADRIANVEMAILFNQSLLKMYRKEYSYFRETLYVPGMADEMWSHLDALFEAHSK